MTKKWLKLKEKSLLNVLSVAPMPYLGEQLTLNQRAQGARRRAPLVADTASRRAGQRRRAAGGPHGAQTAATRPGRESPWKCTRKKRAPNGARFFVALPPAGRLCRSRFCAPAQRAGTLGLKNLPPAGFS